METTTEQLMTDLTDASKDHHDEISTRPCAYTQLLVDALCTENKAHSENHDLAEELLISQPAADLSPPPSHFRHSDLKDSEHEQGDTVVDLLTNPTTSASTIINEEITQEDEEHTPLSPLWRATPRLELDDTNNLQIIGYQSSGTVIQLPRLHSYEGDEEIPSNSPLDNAPSSSLPPSSSPSQIFSSSPFASSQSSLVEIEHDNKAEDRTVIADSGGQDSINSPDVVHLDIVEEGYDNQHYRTDVDHKEEKHEFGDFAIQAQSPKINQGAYDSQVVPNHPTQKRPWTEEKINVTPIQEDIQLAKRMKTDHAQAYLRPAPKRATLASQQQQFKKLIAPFRPPSMLKKDRDAPSEDLAKSKNPLPGLLPTLIPKQPLTPQKPHPHHVHAAPSVTPAKTRVRTLKAASQFKSPLSSSAADSSGRGLSIRLTSDVQSLERKLQLLRRAVKVKENDEEITLIRLVKKWTEAGREVAYELWDLVKDSANNEDGLRASAWGGGASKGRSGSEDRNWGWDSPGIKREGYPENDMNTTTETLLDPAYTHKICSEDDEQTRNNMGTMLRRLGIAPETLGWDEGVEAFVD